jgi:ubiquinone/menaquinone biosynthesis C-methylase UbiE
VEETTPHYVNDQETRVINSKINFCLMKDDDFRIYAEYYDQIYLNMKDYQKEATIVKDVIKQLEKKESKTLLDVGCGTGEHLKHLWSEFKCIGIDINRIMLKTARYKVPNARFQVGDMINFRLRERFDVIICLFSVIGYVKDFDNLVKTLENFSRHLQSKGLVIVEPWIFKKDFIKGYIGLDTYEDEKVKFVRMATSKIVGSRWIVSMHYLVGEKGKISYSREVHKMLALNYADYVKAFGEAGFKDTQYLTENLWENCRGLFITTK